MLITHRALLSLAVLSLSCGVEPPSTDEPTTTEAQPLTIIGGGGGPGTPSTECAQVCTTTSRCDTACGGPTLGSSCGAYGVCVACSAVCNSGASCGQVCLEGSTLTNCRGAGRVCQSCSAATCEAAGCGGYCMTQKPDKCTWCKNAYQRCDGYGAVTGDRDSDGMSEAFELQLAQHFFPSLNMSAASQYQFYGLTTDSWGYSTVCAGNPNCKLPFVVRKVPPLSGDRNGWCADGQCVEILYALTYNWDLGDVFQFTSHRGDAEFVAVLVAFKRADDEPNGIDWGQGMTWDLARNNVNAWRTVGRYYAAHLCSDADSSRFVFPKATLDGSHFWYEDEQTMAVWVAESKNGSYPSFGTCDEGGYWFDNCENGRWLDRNALIPKLVNVGESYGGTFQNPGYVCAGFDTTIAKPMYAFSPSTSTLQAWGTERFDSSTSLYNLFHRFELEWGPARWHCW